MHRRGRFVARVDFLFEREKVVLEALGYEHHRTRDQMLVDARRFNELQLGGYRPYQFTFGQVSNDPESVVDTVCLALLGRGDRRTLRAS